MAAVRCGVVRRGAMWRGGRVENRHHYCDRGRWREGDGGPNYGEVSTVDSSRAVRCTMALHGEQMQLISPY